MRADWTTVDAGLLDALDHGVKVYRRTDSDGVTWRLAGRGLRLDARQIQTDDVFAGLYISVSRRTIGVLALRQERKTDDFQVKFLRARQVTHGKGDMV